MTTSAVVDEAKVLKKHGITAKQVALCRMVAKHPIHGVNIREFGRVVPSALKHDVIHEVWLDRSPPIRKLVYDTIPGSNLQTSNNQWHELSERAVACLKELDPEWTYTRPSDRWKEK